MVVEIGNSPDNPSEMLVLRKTEAATIPSKVRESDSCFDLYSAEEVIIRDNDTVLVDLGIHVIIPKGFEFRICERSGLATKGVIIGAGVVDQEYRGPMKVVMRYMKPRKEDAPNYFVVSIGDRIAQGKLQRRVHQVVREISEAEFSSDTDRGQRGFGSSGN